jgi:hypothetical protein
MGTVSGELPKFGWFEMLARVSERFTFNSNCRKRFGRPTKACPNPPDLELCRALSRPGVCRQALEGRADAACSLCVNSASGRTEVEVDSEMEGRGIGNREWGVRSEE